MVREKVNNSSERTKLYFLPVHSLAVAILIFIFTSSVSAQVAKLPFIPS